MLILLLGASFWCWAIIFDKSIRLRRLRGQAERSSRRRSGPAARWRTSTTASAARPADPMAAVFVAAMREWRALAATATASDDRLAGRPAASASTGSCSVTVDREMDRLERHMGFLASVGSTAPFVGLFGTVWGIMNALHRDRDAARTPSLAVVAPGIAEALFATALGLLAAIPAVIAYNKLSNDLDRYAGRLEAFAGEFRAHPVAPARREGRADGGPIQRRSGRAARGRAAGAAPMSEINVTPHGRRDAGAADRLHGDGAAADRRRPGRPAEDPGAGAWPARTSRWSSRSTPKARLPAGHRDHARGLGPRLVAITQTIREVSAFSCAATRRVAYGDVMTVMGALNQAGFTHVALIAELPDEAQEGGEGRAGAPASRCRSRLHAC